MPTFQLELQFDEKGAVNAVRQLGKVADAAGKAQQAVKDVEKGAEGPKKVAQQAEIAANSLGKLQKSFALLGKIAIPAAIALKITQFLSSIGDISEEYKKLESQYKILGDRAGYTAQELNILEQVMLKNGVSAVEARKGVITLTGANIQASDAVDLLSASLDASSISGKTAAQALNIITAAIVGNNEKSLASLNIQADFNAAYRNIAESLDKAVYALTEQEKQQARVNATLEAAKNIAGSYENYLSDAEIASNELSSSLDSLRLELADTFSIDNASLIKGFSVFINFITNQIQDLKTEAQSLGAVFRGEIGFFEMFTKSHDEAKKWLNTSNSIEWLNIQIEKTQERLNRLKESQNGISYLGGFGSPSDAKYVEEEKLLKTYLARREALEKESYRKRRAEEQRENQEREKNTRTSLERSVSLASGILNKGERSAKTKDVGSAGVSHAIAKWKDFTRQIEVLNGATTKTDASLERTLDNISDIGKAAGKSAAEIQQMRDDYTAAFKSNALKDFNKELLQARGNTKALRQIEIDDAVKGWEQQFKAAGVSAAEAQLKIEALRAALEKKQDYQDLQTAVGFYDELAQLSGDFTASLEKQNELIALKAEIYRQNGIPPALVAEWELLQKIEKARDPWSGFTRGMRKWSADATNMAQQVETSLTSAFDSASDALADFVMTGKLDFADLANSIISDLARIAARQAIGGIVGGIAGMFTGGGSFGGAASGLTSFIPGAGFGGAASGLGNMIPGVSFSAHGNVFSAPGLSAHSNTVVDEPTFFGYDRHFTAFASGAGLMGEAGPEAVMPLSRMSGGDLGVKVMWPDDMMRRVVEMDAWKANVGASQEMMQAIARMNEMRAERAAASPEITVNVYNSTGQQVTQQSRTDQFGNKTLDVYVGDMAAKQAMTPGSRFSKVIATQTGQQVPAIRR